MNCPTCRKAVEDGSRFCQNGGQALTTAAAGATADPGAAGSASMSVSPTLPAPVSGLIGRVLDVLLRPRTTWPVIAAEQAPATQLVIGYVMPLAAIQALVSFVRVSVIGVRLPFDTVERTPVVQGLFSTVLAFGLALAGVFVLALIVNVLAPTFKGTRDSNRALKIVAYAMTPAWLGALFGLLPALGTLLGLLATLYAIYLLYLGLPVLMQSPQDKAVPYTAAVVACSIVLGILLGAVAVAVGVGHQGWASHAARSDALAQRRGADAAGNMIGNALGTDQQGKSALGAALNNMAEAGRQIEQNDKTRANGDSAPAAADAQPALDAVGGLLTALGGALGGSHRVAPVDYHTLAVLLPASMPGMQRGAPSGSSKEAMGVHATSASVDFTGGGDARINVTISDLSGVSGLMDLASTLAHTDDAQSANGYEKDLTIDGRPVHAKYDNVSRRGELSVIVAKRFEVDIEGSNVEMNALRHALAQVDLGKLEAMRNANPQTR